MPELAKGENQINWQIRPKLSNYLRVQDIMILQIIEDAIKDRPIYFAVTVAPNNRMGLDNYLEMEGLVYRVTFEESSKSTSMPRLNYDRMIQNISETDSITIALFTIRMITGTTSMQDMVFTAIPIWIILMCISMKIFSA